MSHSFRNYRVGFFRGFVVLCLLASRATSFAEEVNFSRDVLPVLSENCFFCHGPDEEKRNADLRLDTEDGVAAAINIADLSQSVLLERILSDDPDVLMPPSDSNRQLTPPQKRNLQKWVLSGAKWGRHWSFEPLVSPAVPNVAANDSSIRNAIDAFVRGKLSQKGMKLAPRAARHTLLRRLSLDLTGLPPTSEELREFLNDQSPEAYERVVDRLLASDAYGERMAWDWLNAARYADSNGYQGDRERTMWPWRDWVVDAFNDNMPYDQFSTLQLAGDLLPDATLNQQLATGFCRNHMINGEGGRIAEENRVDYVMDMTETMGTVWLGLTLNCCRCHDHKYDPLTQNEYYQFFAFFNQTPVTGGGGDPQTAPVVAAPSGSQQQQLDSLTARIEKTQNSLTALAEELSAKQAEWEQATLADNSSFGWQVVEPVSVAAEKQELTILDDQSVLVGGTNAEKDTYTVRFPVPTKRLASLRLEALRHPSMTKGRIARSDSGNFVLTEIECSLFSDGEITPLTIAAAEATFEQGDLTVEKTFDGNSNTGWAVLKNGEIAQDHAAVFRFDKTTEVPQGAELRVILKHKSRHKFHNLGRFRVSLSDSPSAGLAVGNEALLTDLQTPKDKRSVEQRGRIQSEFLKADPEYAKLTDEVASLRKQKDNLLKAAPKVMVMARQQKLRTTFVLNRGLYNDVTDREVKAATPLSLPKLHSADDNPTRLDLAKWLFSKEHPLTARVTVNRFWQQVFGIGLVKTVEDFGVQAEYPEHKDLLDWLAADFRENGWDVKRLMKTIVMSHTYQQSSADRPVGVPAADGTSMSLTELDPENRLLARGARYRLPAWMLRDQALAVSGLLNAQVGGAPVNTYQPPGVWEEATFGKKKYVQDTGDKLYRRSLYIFWRRIIAPTMFFDNASRQTCTVKSFRTNTPLHALLTFNETTYVEAARHLAQRILADTSLVDDEARIAAAFRRVCGRSPAPEEVTVLLAGVSRSRKEFEAAPKAAEALLSVGDSSRDESIPTAEHAAWASACLALLNLDETLSRE